MLDQFLAVLVLQCVQHVKEELPVWHPALRHLVWEVLHELHILPHQRPERDHAELVVHRHLHELHIAQLEELLMVEEDLLQEVLVDLTHTCHQDPDQTYHVVRRHVELHLLLEVPEEVGLGGEPPEELLRHLALLGFDHLVNAVDVVI